MIGSLVDVHNIVDGHDDALNDIKDFSQHITDQVALMQRLMAENPEFLAMVMQFGVNCLGLDDEIVESLRAAGITTIDQLTDCNSARLLELVENDEHDHLQVRSRLLMLGLGLQDDQPSEQELALAV